MDKIVVLNCIGYSLGQCYDSNIEICCSIQDDDDLLKNLKKLATEYKALSDTMTEDELNKVYWIVSNYFIKDILDASCLDDIYPRKNYDD